MTISDRGPGFDAAMPRDVRGLSGLCERVQRIGGDFDIESSSANGTSLIMILPREALD